MSKVIVTVSEAGVEQIRIPVSSLSDEQQAMKLLARTSVAIDLLSRAAQDFASDSASVPNPDVENEA